MSCEKVRGLIDFHSNFCVRDKVFGIYVFSQKMHFAWNKNLHILIYHVCLLTLNWPECAFHLIVNVQILKVYTTVLV